MRLKIREIRGADFPSVRRIAFSSFPALRRLMGRGRNSAHYEPDWPRQGPFGPTRVLVAENARGRLCGYIYYQMRWDGDMYLRELAARPPHARDRVPRAGTRLLAHALREAVRDEDVRRATLNVVRCPEGTTTPADIRDPVGYYAKFGFAVQRGEAGYMSTGAPRPTEDVWMAAVPAVAYGRLIAYLARRRPVGGRGTNWVTVSGAGHGA